MGSKPTLYILEDSSFSSYGGGQVVTEAVIKYLIGQGYNIAVADYSESTVFQQRIKQLQLKKIYLKYGLKRSQSNAMAYQLPSVIEVLRLLYFVPYDIFMMRRIISTERKVVLYSTTRFTHVIAMLISMFSKTLWIAHVHSNERSVMLRLFMKSILLRANKIIFVSNYVSNLYQIKSGTVLYNPVDLKSTTVRSDYKSKVRFAFVGNLMQWKGIDTYLDAAAMYLKKNEDAEFNVFGDGIKLEDYKTRYPDIQFHGRVDRSRLFSKFDILVLPSLDSESCPMVILESIVMNKLCITTNFGGQKELIEKFGGLLVDPNDVLSLIDAFKQAKTYKRVGNEKEYNNGLMDINTYGNKFTCLLNNIEETQID